MDLLSQIIARAKSNKQRIVLPEGTEERTLKAADRLLADEVADLIIIGNPEEIKGLAAQWGLTHLDKATIIDPENHPMPTVSSQVHRTLQVTYCAPHCRLSRLLRASAAYQVLL